MNTVDILLPYLIDDINNSVSMNKRIKLWDDTGVSCREIVNDITFSEINKWNFTRLSIDFYDQIQLFFENNRLKHIYFEYSPLSYSSTIILQDEGSYIICGNSRRHYLCKNNISSFTELAFLICNHDCFHRKFTTKLSDNDLVELFSKFSVLKCIFTGPNDVPDLSNLEIEI